MRECEDCGQRLHCDNEEARLRAEAQALRVQMAYIRNAGMSIARRMNLGETVRGAELAALLEVNNDDD